MKLVKLSNKKLMQNIHISIFNSGRFSLSKIFIIILMIFISWKILTPPTNNSYIKSPDGKYEARLKEFDYMGNGIPSYKVYYRKKDQQIWKNLNYSPSSTNNIGVDAIIKWVNNNTISLYMGTNQIWISDPLQ